ncbi:hypothetical protein H2248_009711 [Termitomyces sp. 'cryptogamus']|nr:hypothetical protein H2248_009711 [Termitomyces sp. 'cryptogamus']
MTQARLAFIILEGQIPAISPQLLLYGMRIENTDISQNMLPDMCRDAVDDNDRLTKVSCMPLTVQAYRSRVALRLHLRYPGIIDKDYPALFRRRHGTQSFDMLDSSYASAKN